MITRLFDIEFRFVKLTECGDPLVKLNTCVNWRSYVGRISISNVRRDSIEKLRRKQKEGMITENDLHRNE